MDPRVQIGMRPSARRIRRISFAAMWDNRARPFVSIVIPCLNEESSITECLDSILSQDYPRDNIEILIADGGSSDDTPGVIERYAKANAAATIRLLRNPERIQAAGCNRAIAASRGDVIVRMDAHARYQADYVTNCVNALAMTGAAIVGGAQRAVWRTAFQRAMVAALESPLAVGDAAYRNPRNEGFVDTVWLGAFRRAAFERVGLYDPCAVTNEDAELNHRVARAGGRVFLSRDIVAYYYPRESLRGLARQYFRYGMGRARTSLKHRSLQSPRPLAPLLLVVALLSLGLAAPFSSTAETSLAIFGSLYLIAIGFESVRIGLRRGLDITPDILAILPTIHFSWGTGFLAGLFRYVIKPNWSEEPRLAPRRPDEEPDGMSGESLFAK